MANRESLLTDMAVHDAEYMGSLFGLQISGLDKVTRFTGCSGLSVSAEVVEHQDVDATGMPMTRKRPGRISYDDIVLKKGLTADKSLLDWVQSVVNGTPERKTGSIHVYDSAGSIIGTWEFSNGWPSSWSASDLDAGTDDIMIEELTITHELLKKTK